MGCMIDEIGFAALLALSGASVAWFFPARRYLISVIRDVALELEDALHPIDATYTLLGLYVGFRASYIVEGLREVRALLTLIPRHALIYLPIVYARGEHDTLVVEAEPHGSVLGEECSIVVRSTRPIRRVLRRLGLYRVECRSETRKQLLAKLLEGCDVCLAAWVSRKGLGVVLRPQRGRIAPIITALVSLAKRL